MSKPLEAMLSARFWPMTARPARPMRLWGSAGAAVVVFCFFDGMAARL